MRPKSLKSANMLVVTVMRIVQTSRTGQEVEEHLATTEETDQDQQMAPIEELIDAIFKKKEMIGAWVMLLTNETEISIDQEEK
jgi:hypothetical protein